VKVQGGATTDQLSDLPTGVPTTIDYVPEAGAPVYHYGDDDGCQTFSDDVLTGFGPANE
jgi:hypothetical protein